MQRNREQEPIGLNRVETIVNKETREYSQLLENMANVYITVFGEKPFNEGAKNMNNEKISLSEYLSFINRPDFILPRNDTKGLSNAVSWMDSLSLKDRESLVRELSLLSRGFEPYYTTEGVLKRFSSDLKPEPGLVPIVSYWGDHEYEVCGFLTGLVVENDEAFFRIVQNTPYLISTHPDIKDQVKVFLKEVGDFAYPLLLEHEGVVIPERRGRENGSRWKDLFNSVRSEAFDRGVKYSSGFTSKESEYYANAQKFGLLDYEFDTTPKDGESMKFFLSTITK